ncbi:speckle-type POZ protein-like A [Schistocerca piceifrons]|uniref:speckle-type POZ protein-like A n=1 Tax=Schistocerca piceifrons TaxID=274613 RepID=UPI001F5F407A|nr:speckle-type POZ protein-like A [Schistocerca piceifrons]
MSVLPVEGGEVYPPPMLPKRKSNNVSAAGITRFEKQKLVYTWTVSGNVGDSLIFECEVEIVCVVWDDFPSLPAPETQPVLARDFANLLESQDFADFILHAGDVRIKAHKAVLAARSPVFARMLQQNTKEAQENYVNILGAEPEVVAEALRYMYSGHALALRDMAQGLLVFADRYDLRELKNQCEVELARRLTVDNAVTYAILAVVNSCYVLQKASVDFIRRHLWEVMGTTAWNEAIHSDPASLEKISQLIAMRL